jgi:hypothetical protein
MFGFIHSAYNRLSFNGLMLTFATAFTLLLHSSCFHDF